MDPSKPQPESNPPPPPTNNPTNLEGVQAIPMPPSTSASDPNPPVNRLEYLARPKVHQIEDTLQRFDALLDSKSKTNLQKLASEQRKMQSVTGHASCNPPPVVAVRSRPTSAKDAQEQEAYFRGLSDPKGYCLKDTLQRFGDVLEEGRRVKVQESVGRLLAAREESTRRHLQSCPSSGVALKESPVSCGVPPLGYDAVEVAKTSKISVPSIHILELTLERFGEQMKPETKREMEIMVQELKAQRETTFKHHTQNHLKNDDQPDIPPKPSFPADYDPVAIAETSKLSWPNQHVLQDTLTHFGKTLKPAATEAMKHRIQDQSLQKQTTHKQHLHDCHLATPPRPRSVRPSPSYDPIAVARTSKVSIPSRHIVKDTLNRYGKVIKPAARTKMQQMIRERDQDRKSTHRKHSENCRYMREVDGAAAARRKLVGHPPGYDPTGVAKTSKVSRPNRHVLKDTLEHYGAVIKPAAKESMQKMIAEREVEK